MTTTTALSAVDALKQTRDLFAATHWRSGTLYSQDRDGKKRFCMVGGICHVYMRAHQTVEDQPFYLGQLHSSELDNHPDAELEDWQGLINLDSLEEAWRAEREFLRTIWPDLMQQGGVSASPDFDAMLPAAVEDYIVNWNDGPVVEAMNKKRGNVSFIIDRLNETIDRLEAA